MTVETAIHRFDRKAPPPSFDIDRLPPNLRKTVQTAGAWGPIACAAAWEIHERENDPPGCSLVSTEALAEMRRTWAQSALDREDFLRAGRWFWHRRGKIEDADARAEAWRYYWNRAELSRREDALTDPQYEDQAEPTWPDDLLLTDAEAAQRLADVEEIEDARAESPEPDPWPT
jgi:hypothetical protein